MTQIGHVLVGLFMDMSGHFLVVLDLNQIVNPILRRI